MITETEFLEALNIIRLYQIQLELEIDNNKFLKKTPLEEIIHHVESNLQDYSVRFKNGLIQSKRWYSFIEEIQPNDFAKIGMVGRKTIKEFIDYKLKNNYL
jgi:hypothetical protein